MSITRNLTLETINFSDTEEVDAFLNEVMAGGLRQVRAESEELVAKGLMDAQGNLLTTELPPDMRKGSERDFGG
jgi:hypothetical protein